MMLFCLYLTRSAAFHSDDETFLPKTFCLSFFFIFLCHSPPPSWTPVFSPTQWMLVASQNPVVFSLSLGENPPFCVRSHTISTDTASHDPSKPRICHSWWPSTRRSQRHTKLNWSKTNLHILTYDFPQAVTPTVLQQPAPKPGEPCKTTPSFALRSGSFSKFYWY